MTEAPAVLRVPGVIGVAIAVLLCAASHAGCTPDRPRDGDAAGRTPTAPAAGRLIGDPAPPDPRPTVEVLDAGRQPRRRLRYSAAAGTRQRVHIEASTTVDIEIAGRRAYSTEEQANEAWFEIEVVSASDDRLDCRLRFDRAAVIDMSRYEAGRANQLRRNLDRLPAHEFHLEIDRRGLVELPPLELAAEVDRDGDRAMVWELFEDAATAVLSLPDEPVGAGARWLSTVEDRGRISVSGSVATEVELVSIGGDRLELAVERKLVIPAQATLYGAGISGLSSIRSSARGRAIVDLGRLHPIAWQTDGRYEMEGAWLEVSEQLPLRVVGRGSESLAAK
jgi:hypothetical protein